MKFLLYTCLFFCFACGKNQVINNPVYYPSNDLYGKIYNLEAYNLIQDAKIEALDRRVNMIEALLNSSLVEINDIKTQLLNAQVSLDGVNNMVLITQTSLDSVIVLQNQINSNYTNMSILLTLLQNQVTNLQSNQVIVISICLSNEKLIKVENNYFAVYMISNNYGTYLGKLNQNIQYQTTDVTHQSFYINSNNQIVCI